MTANQRRPGFRLPWSSDEEDGSSSAASESAATDATPTTEAAAAADEAPERAASGVDAEAPATPPSKAPGATPPAAKSPEAARTEEVADRPHAQTPAPARAAAAPAADAAPATEPAASPDFMRELVAAMRRVADEARQTGITEVRSAADERVKRLEADAETRRNELRARADSDVAGIGEWAKAEAERIRKEAEQRVVARRSQLDQQLSGETARAEAESKALRDRVAEYERELEAYHAQLAEINDPAAFAAAAKRMPRPPSFEPRETGSEPATDASSVAPATTVAVAPAERAAETNGVKPSEPEVHPAEEQVLASRLAELDAKLADAPAEADAPAPVAESTTTEIVVSGLGSFGAITGFRQSLSGVNGIEGVALSLGQTGEFIFRATHRAGFDLASAITGLEGESAKIEARDDGSLHVTLDRAR